MTHPEISPQVAERMRRIENDLWLDPSAWSQAGRRATLAERMAFYTTRGLSVALINNGELEWACGYGVIAAGRPVPVTPATIFQACSISKHVAMVGALRLVQEGLLDLDEEINRYLVSWKLPANGPWQPHVTIRQLLGHSAGLTQNWYRGFRRGTPTPTLLQVLEGQPPANTPPVRAALLPGSQFRYSGSHYSVLQQVMIDVTGTPFPRLMQELVFEPLDMRNSSYDQAYPDTRPDSTAVGHYIGGEAVHGQWRVIPEMAGAGLWTTPADLAHVACEIQRAYAGRPTRFLTKVLVDQALAPHASPTFGLGVQLEGAGAALRFGHGGDNIGYKCVTTAYADHGAGAVVMTNADDGYWVALELLHAIAHEYAWPDYLPNRNPIDVDSRSYRDFVGEYELRSGFSIQIKQHEDTLLLQAPGQQPFELHPSSATTFFAQAVSSEITFEQDDAEGVTGLIIQQEEQRLQAKKVR